MTDDTTREGAARAVLDQIEDALDAAPLDPEVMTDEQVVAALGEHGFNVAALAARAEGLAQRHARGELGWQRIARQRIARHQTLLEQRAPRQVPSSTRERLLGQLERLRRLPGAERQVAAYFRNKSPQEADERELEGLIEDLLDLQELLGDEQL